MARLTKRDVEELLDGYDADPVAALTHALRKVLEQRTASFDELIVDARIGDARRGLLARREVAALDDLAAELNERRHLD